MESTNPPVLQLSHISKTYTNIMANDNISLKLNRGHIHALLGENGAGKSTLVKIIYGLVKPDNGKMIFNAKTARLLMQQRLSVRRAKNVWSLTMTANWQELWRPQESPRGLPGATAPPRKGCPLQDLITARIF